MALKKAFSMFLIALIVSSVIFGYFGIVNAESTIPKPSVPEFSLRYIDYSYSVPPTYGTNDYTGERTTLSEGYDVINRTVQFTIKNQPFNGYTDSNGDPTGLYYHIRYKGSYGESWSGASDKEGNSIIFRDSLVFPASNSSASIVNVGDYSYAGNGAVGDQRLIYINLPSDGKIDFQVQALIGNAQLINVGMLGDFSIYNYNFSGQVGDWSNTHTLTIGENSADSVSPNPTFPNLTSEPLQNSTSNISLNYSFSLNPGAFVIIIAVLVGVIAVLVVSFICMKQKGAAKHA